MKECLAYLRKYNLVTTDEEHALKGASPGEQVTILHSALSRKPGLSGHESLQGFYLALMDSWGEPGLGEHYHLAHNLREAGIPIKRLRPVQQYTVTLPLVLEELDQDIVAVRKIETGIPMIVTLNIRNLASSTSPGIADVVRRVEKITLSQEKAQDLLLSLDLPCTGSSLPTSVESSLSSVCQYWLKCNRENGSLSKLVDAFLCTPGLGHLVTGLVPICEPLYTAITITSCGMVEW